MYRSNQVAGRTSRRLAAQSSTPPRRLRSWYLLLPLLLVALLFRLPTIINAAGLSSDPAIVGLQALHMLRGEWSWFLWGAGYQGSFDTLVLAVIFALVGSTPLTIMLGPLLGYLIVIALTFDILKRHTGYVLAALLVLPIIFTPRALNSVTLYAPRQWCITCVFAAIWLLDAMPRARRPLLYAAAGACLSVMALYLDLYALQLLPALGLFALVCSFDGSSSKSMVVRRVAACAAGWVIGFFLLWLIRESPGMTVQTTSTSLAPARLPHNLLLLWNTCLPWLLGYKVFVSDTAVWQPPLIFHVVQLIGAFLLLLGILVGGAALLVRRLPWSSRRLGALGCIATLSSLAGFLVSTMPVDQYSARYLAPIIWTSPFALVPIASALRTKRFAVVLAPYILAAAVGGWLSFGPYVQGLFPVVTARGEAKEEALVGDTLRRCGIHYAASDFWLAYRLTFLWHEQPIVVPLNAWQDRYPPYRQAWAAAPVMALIFHPSEPQAQAITYEAQLRRSKTRFQRIEVADFTLLVVDQRGGSGDSGAICPS